ncbi:hypothetical protein SmJEL517_g01836 [Synchytrium microbalum]|uniref:Eukaryotic translation initiation factor 3 subunit K n=1 Tax=Synchytrium microbalum TaxID=1806994 RepID=A0A507C9F9_9FUNG|nr:uncharacterized protein SmJEL517_g01836 [Synchytrium microbalum]TPX35988.1 hypothetical protein SmJEL517_g01836 [Synchytrium microbalum]
MNGKGGAQVNTGAITHATDTLGLPPRPEHRPADVHSVVETVDRYNPENIPKLEEYVRQQLEKSFYDRDANLSMLKLYQFNPNHSIHQLDTTINILIKALTALPDPDFNLYLALLTEEVMTEETIERLIALQQLLESCRFEEFWKLVESTEKLPTLRDVLEPCRDFDVDVRDFVALTLSIAYQAVQMDSLVKYLGLEEGEDVRDFIKEKGWSTEKSGNTLLVKMVSSVSVTKPLIVEQHVKFGDLKKIIQHGRILA